jgi:multisubunit Na+/H+ antiporter MnhC subunit
VRATDQSLSIGRLWRRLLAGAAGGTAYVGFLFVLLAQSRTPPSVVDSVLMYWSSTPALACVLLSVGALVGWAACALAVTELLATRRAASEERGAPIVTMSVLALSVLAVAVVSFVFAAQDRAGRLQIWFPGGGDARTARVVVDPFGLAVFLSAIAVCACLVSWVLVALRKEWPRSGGSIE